MISIRNLAMMVGAAAFSAAMATGASAASITFYNSLAPNTGERGTLTCTSIGCESGDFLALIAEAASGGPTYSATVGKMFTVHPPEPAQQMEWVNANLMGGDGPFGPFDPEDEYKTEIAGDGGNYTITTNALYVLLKIGGGNTLQTALVKNASGGELSLNWKGKPASGLSHFGEFGLVTIIIDPDPEGEASPIPLPAAGWLLIGGLGALVAVRRRKRTT